MFYLIHWPTGLLATVHNGLTNDCAEAMSFDTFEQASIASQNYSEEYDVYNLEIDQ